jgi:hypothetical protein
VTQSGCGLAWRSRAFAMSRGTERDRTAYYPARAELGGTLETGNDYKLDELKDEAWRIMTVERKSST